MSKYEISTYINGIKQTRIVQASDKKEAENIGWELFDVDTIYIREMVGES